jgi:hypothetical protein
MEVENGHLSPVGLFTPISVTRRSQNVNFEAAKLMSVDSQVTFNGESANMIAMSSPSEALEDNGLAPFPPKGESAYDTRWSKFNYNNVLFDAIRQLAFTVRGCGHTCLFGERRVGGFNVAITLKFDDGVEWIFKGRQRESSN